MTRTIADTEIIATAVQLACRAPSLHNSQPWRWVVTEFADSRAVIQDLTDSRAFPQFLIRVGRAPALEKTPAPTPRRPMSEVMQIRR